MDSYLKILFKFVRVLGIMPVEYRPEEQKLVGTKRYVNHMFRLTIFVLILNELLVIFVCISAINNYFDFFEDSKTSSGLAALQILQSGLNQMSLNTIFFIFRMENVKAFNLVLTVYKQHFPNRESRRRSTENKIRFQCSLHLMLVVVFVSNVVVSSLYVRIMSWDIVACNIILTCTNFIYSSLYLCCLSCLLQMLNRLLKSYNDKLQIKVKMRNSCNEIVAILRERNKLLALCSRNLNVQYGLAMLIQSLSVLICISAFLFLSTVTINVQYMDIGPLIFMALTPMTLYALPPAIIYCNVFWVNNLDKEVKHISNGQYHPIGRQKVVQTNSFKWQQWPKGIIIGTKKVHETAN